MPGVCPQLASSAPPGNEALRRVPLPPHLTLAPPSWKTELRALFSHKLNIIWQVLGGGGAGRSSFSLGCLHIILDLFIGKLVNCHFTKHTGDWEAGEEESEYQSNYQLKGGGP